MERATVTFWGLLEPVQQVRWGIEARQLRPKLGSDPLD
jgi:hypothetical protein